MGNEQVKPSSDNSFYNLVQGAWRAMEGQRGRFALFVTLFVLAYTIELLVPWAVGYTISVFVTHGFTPQAFELGSLGIAAFLALRIGNTAFHHLGRYVQYSVAYSARMEELNKTFNVLLQYKLHWHVRGHSGENLAKLQRAAQAINATVGQYSWQIIDGLVKTVLAGIALFALDAIVALNVIVMSVGTLTAMVYFNRRMAVHLKTNYRFENKINRICVDYLSNIVTVKTLGFERFARGKLRSQKNEGATYAKKISGSSELKWGSINIGNAFVTASSLYIYFNRASKGGAALDVTQVYVLINYLDKIFAAISSFTAYYGGVIEAYTAYDDALELEQVVKNEAERVEREPREYYHWRRFSLRSLSFTYVKGEPGLHDVWIDVEQGEKIALIGLSGGGKSTFLKILGGIVPPEQYELEVDDVRGTDLEVITSTALLIPQEPQIFSDTLVNNLRMGDDFDPEELEFFISLCKLDALVHKLPQLWNTDLAANGLNLSGGEKQRVSVARGLLRGRRKRMILLDEPTSSLDPKTESEILISTFRHFHDKTIIASCHRLNLLPLFDKVVHVEGGVIKEVGAPAQFLEMSGNYSESLREFRAESTLERIRSNS